MPVQRMKMRPWLEKMINSSSVSGLTWMDKEKTIFSIPWKHAARHGWELDKDANLFKQWAIHTGKYSEGQTTDPKTWKANFRCAMNSLPDVEEVKDKSINKGHQAKRIFRLLPVTPKEKRRKLKNKAMLRRKRSEINSLADGENSDTEGPTHQWAAEESPSPQENTVDSTVHTEQPAFLGLEDNHPLEVPDWSLSVEIGSDGHVENKRFQVSPEHSTDYNMEDDIMEIFQLMPKESLWSNIPMGLPANEPCTSPGSLWSDSSSADELDEHQPQYLTLGSDCQFLSGDPQFGSTFFNFMP